jgi:hypothetical protein
MTSFTSLKAFNRRRSIVSSFGNQQINAPQSAQRFEA